MGILTHEDKLIRSRLSEAENSMYTVSDTNDYKRLQSTLDPESINSYWGVAGNVRSHIVLVLGHREGNITDKDIL